MDERVRAESVQCGQMKETNGGGGGGGGGGVCVRVCVCVCVCCVCVYFVCTRLPHFISSVLVLVRPIVHAHTRTRKHTHIQNQGRKS